MKSLLSLDSRSLDQSWRIVIVVTPDTVAQVQQTLEEVACRSLGPEISLLAADEASVRKALAECAYPVDYKLPARIAANAYWTTVLSNYSFDTDRTIFLLAGTRVPDHWDARLVTAGQRASDASAIAPLCVRHPILSAFADPAHKPGLTVDEIDQWLNDYVDGIAFTVPVMLPSCLLLQGEYWQQGVGVVANDQELLESLRHRGKLLLSTDQVYVDDSRTAYSNDVSFLPKAYLDAYAIQHPLTGIRHSLTELSLRREKPPVMRQILPVQLHIGHSWGGGLARWMEDFIAADKKNNHLVLRSIGDLGAFGQQIALYRSTDMGIPIRTWTLCEPILSVSLESFEYKRMLAELIRDHNVESLVISSFIGHSLDLLRTSLPTTCVLHDFFPFCPALYATFGSPCDSCDAGQMRTCSNDNPLHSFFKHQKDEHWMAARSSFIDLLNQESIAVIAPTQSVVQRYRQLEPGLEQKKIHVVPHGLDEKLIRSLAPLQTIEERQTDDRLRVVVLGRLTPEKGADILAGMLEQLTAFADVYLLGAGDSGTKFESIEGVTIMDSYDMHELGDFLLKINPDLGLLLSTVPETFSYTLSELWAAGIPVLATRLGAFADRITDMQNGWLVDPEPAAVVEKLQWLNDERQLLYQAKVATLRQDVRRASHMTADYDSFISWASNPVPLIRYNLPRRSYCNPYTGNLPAQGGQALHINQQVPYRRALAEFLTFSGRKMEHSPKLPQWLRGSLGRVLHHLARRSNSK